MNSFKSTSTTHRIKKYSRSYCSNPQGAVDKSVDASEWEHFDSPRLRVSIEIMTPQVGHGVETANPRYRLRVFEESTASITQASQGAGDKIWEDIDLTSFSELSSPLPVSGLPLKAVYRDCQVGFRYLFPLPQRDRSEPLQKATIGHRRFQLVFSSAAATDQFINLIRPVCPCSESSPPPSKPKGPDGSIDQSQPVSAPVSASQPRRATEVAPFRENSSSQHTKFAGHPLRQFNSVVSGSIPWIAPSSHPGRNVSSDIGNSNVGHTFGPSVSPMWRATSESDISRPNSMFPQQAARNSFQASNLDEALVWDRQLQPYSSLPHIIFPGPDMHPPVHNHVSLHDHHGSVTARILMPQPLTYADDVNHNPNSPFQHSLLQPSSSPTMTDFRTQLTNRPSQSLITSSDSLSDKAMSLGLLASITDAQLRSLLATIVQDPSFEAVPVRHYSRVAYHEMKRSADVQLTRDGNEDEADDVERTGFQGASAEELSTRKIKGLPKRRTAGATSRSSTPGEAEATPKPSLFGGFSGFGATPSMNTNGSTESAPPKPSGFASFGGFGTTNTSVAPKPPSLPFSLTPSTNTTQPSKTSQLFGASLASASVSLSEAKNSAEPPFSTGRLPLAPSAPFSFGSGQSSSTPKAPTTSSPSPPAKDASYEYLVSLRGLNHSVITAIESAIAADPFVNLPFEAIFKAYSKYREEIESKSGPSKTPTAEVKAAAPAPPPSKPPTFNLPAGGFSWGQPPKPTTTEASSTPAAATMPTEAPKPLFSFAPPTKPATSNSAELGAKPPILFGAPTGGQPSIPNFFTKPDDKPKAPTPTPFGTSNIFAPKPESTNEAKTEKDKPTDTSSNAKPSLYPFSAFGESKPTTTTSALTASKPAPTFFSFSGTPAATPAQTPPAPNPVEKRPPLTSFGFGSGSSPRGSFSFGSATPGMTPPVGSLGNPVGFSFGSPPKDTAAGVPTPTPSTTAGLQAASAAANPFVPPASSVVSLNFRIHSGMNPQIAAKPTIVKFNGHDEGQPVAFQVRVKTPELAKQMVEQMKELARETEKA
ncbi:hypothetical protein FRB99_007061 [Tulasnella sp. 403]|nr:hypothetical protein FRB99_007061 [Tulasnella sp. 403]